MLASRACRRIGDSSRELYMGRPPNRRGRPMSRADEPGKAPSVSALGVWPGEGYGSAIPLPRKGYAWPLGCAPTRHRRDQRRARRDETDRGQWRERLQRFSRTPTHALGRECSRNSLTFRLFKMFWEFPNVDMAPKRVLTLWTKINHRQKVRGFRRTLESINEISARPAPINRTVHPKRSGKGPEPPDPEDATAAGAGTPSGDNPVDSWALSNNPKNSPFGFDA